jgi:hypothetical protein
LSAWGIFVEAPLLREFFKPWLLMQGWKGSLPVILLEPLITTAGSLLMPGCDRLP